MSPILLCIAHPQCLSATRLSSPEIGNGPSWSKPQYICSDWLYIVRRLEMEDFCCCIEVTCGLVRILCCADDLNFEERHGNVETEHI